MTRVKKERHAMTGIRLEPMQTITPHPSQSTLRLKSVGEAVDVVLKVALIAEELDIGAVNLDPTLLALGDVILTAEAGEAPVLADDDLLAARELTSVSRI